MQIIPQHYGWSSAVTGKSTPSLMLHVWYWTGGSNKVCLSTALWLLKRNQWQQCCSVSLRWGWPRITLLLFYQQHMEECKVGKQTLSLHVVVHHWHKQQDVWPDPLNWYCNHPGCFGAERERKKEPTQYNVHTRMTWIYIYWAHPVIKMFSSPVNPLIKIWSKLSLFIHLFREKTEKLFNTRHCSTLFQAKG